MRIKQLNEGYKILPQIDKDKYPEINGLEGPFRTLNGAVVYYDPKEGSYYDKDRDVYLSYDEFRELDNDYSDMKDERDIKVKEAFGNPEPSADKSGYPANIDSLRAVKRQIEAGRMDLVDALINSMIGRLMHDNNTKESVAKGYKELPNIDRDCYGERDVPIKEAKLSPEQKDRLDDLIDELRYLTMPYNDWDDFNNVEAARKVIDTIRSEFGDKIAAEIEKGSEEIWHGYRPNVRQGYDKLANKKSTRVTKSGKANKADISALKSQLKRHRGYSKDPSRLPESDNVQESLTLDYSRYVRSHGKKPRDQGHGGIWMFTTAEYGEPGEEDMFQFQGSFADAKKAAAKWAKSQGAYRFYVMETDIVERELTGGEKRSREANVKKLKKHIGNFEKTYGDDAESVMYAVATKRAKGESIEETDLDEVSTDKLRDYASAALQDKNKAKADKRWKYASKAMKTVGDREAKAANDLKYNKMESAKKVGEATDWEVSYDHGPHQSNTISVKAKSKEEALDKAKQVAKDVHKHNRITSIAVYPKKNRVEEADDDVNARRKAAMDRALKSIEMTFGPERKAVTDQIHAMTRAADMMTSERWRDRALSVVDQYGINSKEELAQEIRMMIDNERELEGHEYIVGADRNVKMLQAALEKLGSLEEGIFGHKDNVVVTVMNKDGKPVDRLTARLASSKYRVPVSQILGQTRTQDFALIGDHYFGIAPVQESEDPCWKGYKQIGMKKKNGKEVPNCVPKKGK